MKPLNKHIEYFIRENIDLIDEMKFDEFYDLVNEDEFGYFSTYDTVGEMTEFFISCGFDPASHMIRIPSGYLCPANITEYSIPESCIVVEDTSFANTSLKKIVFPETVTKIECFSFEDCKDLEEVVFMNPDVEVNSLAFLNDSSIRTVIFNGPMSKVEKLVVGNSELKVHDGIICTDGIYKSYFQI